MANAIVFMCAMVTPVTVPLAVHGLEYNETIRDLGRTHKSIMKIAELLRSLADDLLIMKRIANRPKDRLDVVALEKIKRGEDPNA